MARLACALAEFTDTPAWHHRQAVSGVAPIHAEGLAITGWRQLLSQDGKNLIEAVGAEIDALIRSAEDERADAMGEIISQSNEFISHFMGVLCATPGSHPATLAMMEAASLIAGLTVQHFKMIEDRHRRSQVCAALRPPIEVPGHASYPSGHATQSYLIALCVDAVLAGASAARTGLVVSVLADRIARNREIAGVHYASDSAAGRQLAGNLATVVLAVPSFAALVVRAKAEWV